MWFDSHCHLHLCEEDEPGGVATVLERARLAGVLEVVAVGIDVRSSERAVELTSERGVYASAGVHPNSADGWNDEAAERIDHLLGLDRTMAVGETGLDFYRDHTTPEQQRAAFAGQINLARKHAKPLVVHTRNSVDEAMDMLAAEDVPQGFIFHCWSGDKKQLQVALDLGAHVSFAGNVSYSKSDDLREAVRYVPDDRLLVETDSPYLTPMPHRGERNEPRHLAFVGLAAAQARGVSAHMLAEQTTQNARRVFGLS
jgi:TatD DNase family protein